MFPYDRSSLWKGGGSPLQNLIVRGHKATRISALQMVEELDAGPVYAKVALDLSGSARKIFERVAFEVFNLIEFVTKNDPDPSPQSGFAVCFKRRTQNQSRLPESATLDQLYDHIRMLDAETYPKAFLQYGDTRLEFDMATFDGSGNLFSRVKFIKRD